MRKLLALACAASLVGCESRAVEPEPEPDGAAVLIGSGDIATCTSGGDEATARVLDGIAGTVFTTGDNVYPNGTAEEYADCYDPSWGRHLDRTRPAMGNHDALTDGGAPYYAYFGDRAGPPGLGYYRYDAGDWAVLVLNSNKPLSPGTPQHEWLLSELSGIDALCTLAYWHEPRFSSGAHGDRAFVAPVWEALYAAGADVVIGGHDHSYERFAPQNPAGEADAATGIRQFVVGTGGASFYPFTRVAPNSEARIDDVSGVLKLTLEPDRYAWQFISVAREVLDEGSQVCH